MKQSNFFQWLLVSLCTTVGVSLTVIFPLLSQTNPIPKPIKPLNFKGIRGFSQLRLRAAQVNKPVRVIARLSRTALTGTPFTGTLLPAAFDTPLTQVNSAQTRIINRLQTSKITGSRPIAGVPLVVVEATAKQLDQLVANGEIAELFEDRISYSSLDSSVPLIRAPQAWNLGSRGGGTTVAILDTGVQSNHPFLAGRVIEEACYSSNLCPGGVESSTAVGSAIPCVDICQHGTHVAGIAAGRASGSTTFNGVAPDASIFAIQVFTRFSNGLGAYDSDIIRGLTRVRDRATALNIVSANMSLGGSRFTSNCDTQPIKGVIDQLLNQRVATVIAAGNNGWRDGVSYPGCISSAITVGATTDSDTVASYSNVSSLVDLLAPGSSINSSISPSGFANYNGTSMAAPHVAGAFAVIRGLVPGATVGRMLTALQSTGKSIAVPGTNPSLSRLRIDLGAIVKTTSTTGTIRNDD
ncbi:MAG: S8 family serine peptidase [Cyanobacteria bacterium LVE1205-1]|jgi:subtilisin family serine protease